jgi:2-polyprenyl-3-methyl-5-hydroxy-6-metoxy-1,4-benzoquinol methylase
MPIRRTNRLNQKKWLKENSHLKILDLGCTHVNYWPEANNFADIEDYSENFKKLNLPYTQIKPNEKLPFKDKEFDYVILSHVMEHVPNLLEFRDEIVRVGKAGYIELPTKLNDNIVFGCDEEVLGHKWWFEFDDDNQQLLYTEKKDVLEKFLSVGSVWKLQKYYEDSFILQFYWENNINLKEREPFTVDEKISFFSLVKKYYSKKIRVPVSKLKNVIKKI